MKKAGKTVGTLTLATAFAIAGCAKVDIKKVPTPTQYVHWTDAMQKKSDKMKGIRFYLPRPFINVFESFPIRTDIYIADGVVSPDGKYVLIKSVKPESGLNDYIAGIFDRTRIPARNIKKPKAEDINNYNKLQGAVEEIKQKEAKDAAKKIPTGSLSSDQQDVTSTFAPQKPQITGINQRSVTNDNAAFAFQPLRGNFDIIYMPDFEEQYVISSFAGLGNAQFVLKLGQGWSLQGFNSITDNSELNKRMYDLIDTAIETAKTAASLYAGGIPLPKLPPGTEKIAELQAGEESLEGAPDARPYTPVSLKIVVVHYAAKGLYPVIKPRELEERTVSNVKGSGAFNFILDLFRSAPFFMSSSDYDPNAIQRAKQAVQNETGKFTVPVYPYQYISFNTFRYMAIEVIKTDTEPFEILYDKTGTKGDPGDRRINDSSNPKQPTPTPTETPNTDNPEDPSKTVMNYLNNTLFTDDDFISTFTNDIKATLEKIEGNKFIVHVVFHGTAPQQYKNKMRTDLSQEIKKAIKATTSKDADFSIELPPSEEQLSAIQSKLNEYFGDDSSNKWDVGIIAVEAHREHTCSYKKTGNPRKNFEEEIPPKFNAFCKDVDSTIGTRTIKTTEENK